MAAVVAWPGSGEPGYVNLQHSYVDRKTPDGKKNGKWPVAAGKPFRDVADLVQRAAWMNTTTQFKDQWFCLSLQSQVKPDPHNAGKLKAVRASANALKLKALWIDIDVKPNQYATLADALKALFEFIAKVGLPPPSALVSSGNGLHVYWISDVALDVAEWAPYAHGLKALLVQEGLKCDAGLTTDQARILRMPGTFNHKSDPPKPVQLLAQPLVCYNFASQISFLTTIAPVPSAVPGQPAHMLFADAAAMAAFKGATPVFTAEGPGLDAGIDKHSDTLIPIAPIMKQCAFYRDALTHGGAEYDQSLWNLSILGATFMENGNAVAHAISQGHATYSPADTQALYDRKVAERAERGIGYPSCAAIAGSGCKACQTCPLLAKGKSPLNLRPVTATVTPGVQSPAAKALSLPQGYDVDDKGIICKVIEKQLKEGETETILLPLFLVKLSGFWAQKNPHRLNYRVEADLGNAHMVSVPMAEMGKLGFSAWLGGDEGRTMVNLDAASLHGKFYMSMLKKLWDESASQESLPFGWHETDGVVDGFTYGGVTRFDNGDVKPCGSGDPNTVLNYTPTGELEPWLEACNNVTNRQRPELDAIMLVGFAAPLVAVSGHHGAVFSSWGESGSGKSSAFTVGLSIWGHPQRTKGKPESTYNNMTTQIGQIRHLPFYIDEIRDDEHKKKAFSLAHDLTDGIEKGRNKNSTTTHVRLTWKLPVVLASNQSFREFIHANNHQNAATLNRVFEWFVKKIDHGPGHISNAQATQTLAELDNNFGRMGELYADFLAKNHKQIKDDYIALSNELEALFKQGTAERFWYMAPTILILAARYASRLGINVSEQRIREWAIGVVQDNIAQRDEQGMTAGIVDASSDMLGSYLAKRDAEERVVWTNYIHRAKGRPPKPVMELHGTSQQRNPMGNPVVRISVDTREVIVHHTDFKTWSITPPNSFPFITAADRLKETHGMKYEKRVSFLSGTKYDAGERPLVMVFNVTHPDHPLWPLLWRYSAPGERLAAEAAAEAEAVQPAPVEVETGLTPTEDVVAFVKGAVRGA